MELIHKFLLTRLPDDSTPETDLHLYTISLAASQSVSSAFSFIRSLPTEKQGSLRDGIWAWAFGAPRIPCGVHHGETSVNQIAIKEILHLPLLPAEDDHLLQFLLSPPRLSSQSLSLLHDLVTLRLIHQGKYAESLQLDKELAGSGGSEESRQKRREMVREFIAILPEAQRRVLAVDGEYVSSRREGNANGYMEIDAPKAITNNVQTAPTPIKQIPAFPLEPTQTPTSIPTPKAATPAPQSRVVSSTNSPFSGPPRFASTSNNQVNSPQIARVLSGSPFTLPMSRGANAVRSASSSGMRTPTMGSRELPIPRPKVRPVIQDEEERGGRNTRKRGRESDVDMEQEQEKESVQENTVGEGENLDTEMEVSKDDVVQEQEQEPEREQEPEETQPEPVPEKQPSPPAPTPRTRRAKPPPPPPASTTPKRTTRKSTIPPPSPLHARIPGSFDLSIPQSVPEDKALQSKPRPARKPKTQPKEIEPPRSRMTRSVSRAISLDMEASPPAPAAAAAKRAGSRRGSTATVASVAEEEVSRRGASPTPSTRSRVGSQTPRKSTRTRK
jgi:hypothetical protein